MARDYPAFLFYPEDFVAGTAAMSPLAVGIYIRCLCHQWHCGSVPDDKQAVARLSGATLAEVESEWPAVSAKFARAKSGLQNKRLEAERAKLKRRKKAGEKGANARWQSGSDLDAVDDAKDMRTECESDRSRVANANVYANGSASEDALAESFERFWNEFPSGRKKTKGRARTAFGKAVKKAAIAEIIVAAGEYAKSDEGRGQFVKMPETWLNGECWNDDREAWKDRDGRRDNSTRGKDSGDRGL